MVTKHRADLPVLCGCFPLAIYFTFGSVYMSMLLSHFVPAYPSPSPCPQVHSLVGLHLYFHPAPRFFITFFFFLIPKVLKHSHRLIAQRPVAHRHLQRTEVNSRACQFTTGSSQCDILTKELGQVTAHSYYHSSLDLWFLTLALQEIMEMMTTTIPARQQITEKHAINHNLK